MIKMMANIHNAIYKVVWDVLCMTSKCRGTSVVSMFAVLLTLIPHIA